MEATSPRGPMVSWEKPGPPKKNKYAVDPIEMTRLEELMEATSPSGPMVSWEKPGPAKKNKYAVDPIEMTEVEQLMEATSPSGPMEPPKKSKLNIEMIRMEQLNDTWIPAYARHFVESIHDFATDPSKLQDEEQKEEFLHSLSNLCTDALLHDFCEDLNDFCTKYKLVEIIQLLLNSEPRDEICSRLRRRAMVAFTGLSCIGASLDIKKILRVCFNSVFFLRPRSEMPNKQATLCTRALVSMDTMLQVIVLNSPGTKSCEMLQDVFEVLLDYLFCDSAVVQDRAMERMKMLCHLLVDGTKEVDEDDDDEDEDDEDEDDEDEDDEDKDDEDEDDADEDDEDKDDEDEDDEDEDNEDEDDEDKDDEDKDDEAEDDEAEDDEDEEDEDEEDDAAPRAPIQIPVLGKLVGHLFFKLFKPQENISGVVEVLSTLVAFLFEQKCAMSESDVEPPEHWEFEILSWVNVSTTWKVQAFGRYLGPDDRTGVVLEAIEILGRSNLMNKDGPKEFLEEAMNSPEMWLTDVPKVVRHIFRYFDEKNTATADSFSSLLVFMANKWPERVISAALEATPNFSDKVSLWKAMFSVRQTLEKVLKELQIQVQDRQDDTFTGQQKSCLTFLSILAYGDVLESLISPLYKNLNLLESPKMEMVPLVLRALETLSESAETARKMKSLLPEMLKFLGHWSWDISVMALDTFRNILGQLKKKEASSMALKAVQRLWSLFDANEECLRERSISLFRELLGKTTWRDKKAMRRNSWKALIQLVVHMSDQAPSVAKASKEAVVAVAELFRWKELKELAENEQIWQIGECLLAKDSSRAEQFVLDSQPYLLSSQAPLREVALRFFGLAAQHLTERNEDFMAAILSELGTVEARDKDPSIRALATQTSLILSSLRDKRKPRLSLHGLCRWCH